MGDQVIDASRRHISDLQREIHLTMDAVHALDNHGAALTVEQIAAILPDDPAVIAYFSARKALADAIEALGIKNEA